MNLTSGTIENKINKANNLWFSGHRTSEAKKKKEEKAQHLNKRFSFILLDT